MNYDEIIQLTPFQIAKAEKEPMLVERLRELTRHHIEHCAPYANMMRAIGYNEAAMNGVADFPFLPVSLFKDMSLKSIPDEEQFKMMTSSGTSGQAVSKIYLDRATAAHQQKTLVRIVSEFLGTSRMPMLIIDNPSVLSNRDSFSARGAGILGFSIFGQDKTYALREDMSLDLPGIEAFLEKHRGQRILLFGFTFMVWQHFYRQLIALEHPLDLSQGVLIQGGGWKKLVSESVSPQVFKQSLREACGIRDVHDYYGMVEQTGCIYMECEEGHLHASTYSDVIVRRGSDLLPCAVNEAGILQVISTLPESYPGHSLLTEDEGVLLGEDDCPCGRKGKYFKVLGRLKNAEIRGCSDTYAVQF